jgi:succinate dehydrogenase / fumarate reductase, iron-sulfur subunit
MDVTIRAWRQRGPDETGRFESYLMHDVSSDASLLEALDVLNERLIDDGIEPIAFESDCREGICGTCGLMVNGRAHGPLPGTATCQLHMRHFRDGETIVLEPFRAQAFPLIRDLVIDRSPLDEIIAAGGYISVNTGAAPDANIIPVPKAASDASFDAAACIQCGACVAACPNAAAHLFTSAKLQHLNLLPQGQPERWDRTEAMVDVMESYFGTCTMHGECHEACPKEISLDYIAYMSRDYVMAKFKNRKRSGQR